MPKQACVYILASGFKHLYIGVTAQLNVRMAQHKAGTFPESFTARYNIHHLVYVERYGLLTLAIAREKQLKRWSRIKKVRLIVAANPTWKDLSEDWGKPLPKPSLPDSSVEPAPPFRTAEANGAEPAPPRSVITPIPPERPSSRPKSSQSEDAAERPLYFV